MYWKLLEFGAQNKETDYDNFSSLTVRKIMARNIYTEIAVMSANISQN